jgi:hypothetical protein
MSGQGAVGISIIKILSSLNTTIYLDVIKKDKQLHVSARGHRQVGSFGWYFAFLDTC